MSHYFKNKERGFTLIELMVTIGIMAVILTVILMNQRNYTEVASLSNLADSLSLTISQAQAYGIAVKEVSPGSADFGTAYGITLSILSSGSNTSYLFFADKNGNGYYDGSWSCPVDGASECLERVDFSGGNYINELCRVRDNPNNPYQCNNIGRIDISFIRPIPEAQMMFFNQSGNLIDYDPEFIGARISVRSPGGITRSVIVYYTGQVSVQ